jgi:hypothetical protein
MPIPPGYASVSVERICQPDFEELEIDIPGGDGEKTLKDALHGIILWPKRYIVIIPREWWISERPPGAGAVIVSTCSRASTIVSGAVIVTTRSLTFSTTTIHMTIRVNGAAAIMMMTSLPIHLSNHSPQALECNLSGRCNHQRKNENDQQRKSPRQRQMKKQKGQYVKRPLIRGD